MLSQHLPAYHEHEQSELQQQQCMLLLIKGARLREKDLTETFSIRQFYEKFAKVCMSALTVELDSVSSMSRVNTSSSRSPCSNQGS